MPMDRGDGLTWPKAIALAAGFWLLAFAVVLLTLE